MKHKNLKLKKACFILTASISLYAYARYEHIYNPNYTITEEEPYFATYSNGRIYIGTQYLKMILLYMMKEMEMILI